MEGEERIRVPSRARSAWSTVPIRHLGTEKAHEVYLGIENYLRDHGVECSSGVRGRHLRDGGCCGS